MRLRPELPRNGPFRECLRGLIPENRQLVDHRRALTKHHFRERRLASKISRVRAYNPSLVQHVPRGGQLPASPSRTALVCKAYCVCTLPLHFVPLVQNPLRDPACRARPGWSCSRACSLSPKQTLRQFAPPSIRAGSLLPRSSCAGISLGSALSRRKSAPGRSPAGNRCACRPGRRCGYGPEESPARAGTDHPLRRLCCGELSRAFPAFPAFPVSRCAPSGPFVQQLLRLLAGSIIRQASFAAVQVAAHLATRHGPQIGALHGPLMDCDADGLAVHGFVLGAQGRLDLSGKTDGKRYWLGEGRRPPLAPFRNQHSHSRRPCPVCRSLPAGCIRGLCLHHCSPPSPSPRLPGLGAPDHLIRDHPVARA